MKYLILILLTACAATPKADAPSDNPNVDVARLLTVDGCTVYRFHDTGHYHYFSNCSGNVSSTIQEGKTFRPEEIPTFKQN